MKFFPTALEVTGPPVPWGNFWVAPYLCGSDGPVGGPGGPGGHWASSALGEISNPQVSEAGSIFPGTPNIRIAPMLELWTACTSTL